MLEVTTTIVPRTFRAPSIELTESNLSMLSSRTRSGIDMMSALRRRTQPAGFTATSAAIGANVTGSLRHQSRPMLNAGELDERKARRISAPAELQRRGARDGFAHPVLAIPGGF
jgi:hypothetical protein